MHIVLILTLNLNKSYSQEKYFSIGDSGELIEFEMGSCNSRTIGVFDVFGDIAITPNANIYGISDRIYLLDTINNTTTPISGIIINSAGGLGLYAFDNDNLLFDRSDSLFIYNISSNSVTLAGFVGYYCYGDFTFYQGKLYMVSTFNDLIKINFDTSSYSITSIQNLGYLNTPNSSVYSVFSVSNSCDNIEEGIYIIDESKVFSVDTLDASITYHCSLSNHHFSYGVAEYSEKNQIGQNSPVLIPNVFTPNGDGVNDIYSIELDKTQYQFRIFNRWGNTLFKSDEGFIQWDGKDRNGLPVSEGVYFYVLEYYTCNNKFSITGHISLLR